MKKYYMVKTLIVFLMFALFLEGKDRSILTMVSNRGVRGVLVKGD